MEARRLSNSELLSVEKTLFELTRRQKRQDSPVELSMPDGTTFWESVHQLMQHMESELSEAIHDDGMSAKVQFLSRRLSVARTCIRDLNRMRLNALTRHALMSEMMKRPQGPEESSNSIKPIDWKKHDPAERVLYNGVCELAGRYKKDLLWNSLVGLPEYPNSKGAIDVLHEPLTNFDGGESGDSNKPIISQSRVEENWEEPDFDEEDRIRELDTFPEHASSQSESRSSDIEEPPQPDELIRIRILKDISDPIMVSDGTEIILTQGDIESCPSLIADTLISAGIAEPAPI